MSLVRTTAARGITLLIGLCLPLPVGLVFPAVAHGWDPFLRENPDVTEGNEAAGEGDFDGALAAYGRAARRLPDAPGVHLNRGLALLRQEKHEEARQALLLAATPDAPTDVRADAYYNLGLSFYQSGNALAEQLDHEQAQQQFREAVDALRRSLRARPGQPNAAWNYELARRRLAEQERRAEEQQQEQDSEEQNEGQEDGSDSQDSPSDQQEGGEQGPENDDADDSPGDSDPEEGSSDPSNEEGDPQPQDRGGTDDQQEQENTGAEDPEGASPDQGGNESAPDSTEEEGDQGSSLPSDVERVLDALQNSEENLQRYRARARARQQNRQPTMDW